MAPLDLYLMEIEKQMENLLSSLSKLAHQGLVVAFSKVIAEMENLEAIKTFIVLLFLAQKGDVALWQDESLSDIYITISGASAGQKPPVGIV
jgi:chromatin segregation and condensation protein Rec8/ScpA/Scc1 (kleisin family)